MYIAAKRGVGMDVGDYHLCVPAYWGPESKYSPAVVIKQQDT